MNNCDTSYTPIPRDWALVAVDLEAGPEMSAERAAEGARAWLLDVALRARHDEGIDPDTGQPRPRRLLSLATDIAPLSADPAASLSYVDEEWPLDGGINRGQWRPHRPARGGDEGGVVMVDPDGTARIGPRIAPVKDGEGVR